VYDTVSYTSGQRRGCSRRRGEDAARSSFAGAGSIRYAGPVESGVS